MLVGVPKEIKNHEYRVGMTPTSVREMVKNGHGVVVETNAGVGIGASDAEYQSALVERIRSRGYTDVFGDVTVRLSGLAGDLDLFVTTDLSGSCDANGCIGESQSYDLADEEVTFAGLAGVTYMVVADRLGVSMPFPVLVLEADGDDSAGN